MVASPKQPHRSPAGAKWGHPATERTDSGITPNFLKAHFPPIANAVLVPLYAEPSDIYRQLDRLQTELEIAPFPPACKKITFPLDIVAMHRHIVGELNSHILNGDVTHSLRLYPCQQEEEDNGEGVIQPGMNGSIGVFCLLFCLHSEYLMPMTTLGIAPVVAHLKKEVPTSTGTYSLQTQLLLSMLSVLSIEHELGHLTTSWLGCQFEGLIDYAKECLDEYLNESPPDEERINHYRQVISDIEKAEKEGPAFFALISQSERAEGLAECLGAMVRQENGSETPAIQLYALGHRLAELIREKANSLKDVYLPEKDGDYYDDDFNTLYLQGFIWSTSGPSYNELDYSINEGYGQYNYTGLEAFQRADQSYPLQGNKTLFTYQPAMCRLIEEIDSWIRTYLTEPQ